MSAPMRAAPVDTLRTRRLLLRPWRPEDRAPCAALNADPRVMEFFPAQLTPEESDALADRCAAGVRDRGWGLWAAEAPGVASFIGFIGLAASGPGMPCTGLVEVGWRLATAHWGHGFATEGARAAVEFAFEALQLPEVVSFTAAANRRSRAVMERLGMRHNGETFDHPRVPEGSPLRRHVLYWLSRDAWRLDLAPDRGKWKRGQARAGIDGDSTADALQSSLAPFSDPESDRSPRRP